jgi:hypothetical protein
MHTVIVIGIGFVLLGICGFAGHAMGGASGTSRAAIVFPPLWLIGAGINLYLGVKRAGYSFKEELPIFLLIFALPAAVAVFVWWRFR